MYKYIFYHKFFIYTNNIIDLSKFYFCKFFYVKSIFKYLKNSVRQFIVNNLIYLVIVNTIFETLKFYFQNINLLVLLYLYLDQSLNNHYKMFLLFYLQNFFCNNFKKFTNLKSIFLYRLFYQYFLFLFFVLYSIIILWHFQFLFVDL